MPSINITRHVPVYNDANLSEIRKDFRRIRTADVLDIAESWDIKSEGLSDIEKSINEIDSYIASLQDKIEEMDKVISDANDTSDALTTEVNSFLNFADGIEIHENVGEVIEWCMNHLNGDWDWCGSPIERNQRVPRENIKYACIYIKSDEDKIHFKLRWG